ncbi:hypothetical protein A4A49_33863 [Nicotiana attenuata]|uniref:Uncharacterized protein n=1 Tax=Nicotiana attenuata TaxID=49451 RepID=A0A1J6I8C6_NICAT|nr:hypothetical protein A4A49_33863 [Nicotiana attenuata]
MEIMINDAFGFTRNNVNEPGASSNHINREEIFDEGHVEGHNEIIQSFMNWSKMAINHYTKGERIEEIRSERAESLDEPSPNDALGIVFGPEHPGRVRGLGLGVVPTVAFKQTSARYRRAYVGSSSTTAPTPAWQQAMTNVKSKLNALISLYERNIGNIPEEFAHLFSTPPQAPDLGSDAPVEPRRSLDESNNDDRPSVN